MEQHLQGAVAPDPLLRRVQGIPAGSSAQPVTLQTARLVTQYRQQGWIEPAPAVLVCCSNPLHQALQSTCLQRMHSPKHCLLLLLVCPESPSSAHPHLLLL